jgi:hypothetical protein
MKVASEIVAVALPGIWKKIQLLLPSSLPLEKHGVSRAVQIGVND